MLFMSLGQNNFIFAETIIVGENATVPDSLVTNKTIELPTQDTANIINVQNVSTEDLQKYAIQMDELGGQILDYLQFVEAKSNRSDKLVEQSNRLLLEMTNTTQTLSSLVVTKDNELAQLNRNSLNAQNKIDNLEAKFPLYLTLVGISTLIFGVVLTNLAYTFKKSQKLYSLIRWVRSWYPFAIELQSADDEAKSRPPYFMILLIGGSILIIIVALVI